MKIEKKSTVRALFALAIIIMAITACKKDPHKQPKIIFKTGSGYTSADATVSKNSGVLAGIIADKTEDDLKTLNVSYAFDGAAATTTKDNFTLSSGESKHYEKDYTITTRNQAGSEKWFFSITDRDGNIANISLMLTVQ